MFLILYNIFFVFFEDYTLFIAFYLLSTMYYVLCTTVEDTLRFIAPYVLQLLPHDDSLHPIQVYHIPLT